MTANLVLAIRACLLSLGCGVAARLRLLRRARRSGAKAGTPTACQPSLTLGPVAGCDRLLFNLDPITLDHGVRQDLVGDVRRQLAGLVGGGGVDLELEVLALADVADAGVAHRMEGLGNRPPLGIEDGRLERNEDPGFHLFLLRWGPTPIACRRSLSLATVSEGTGSNSTRLYDNAGPNTRPKIESTFRSWSLRSNAFSISAAGKTLIRSVSASSSDLKSFCSWNDRMAFRCTHS